MKTYKVKSQAEFDKIDKTIAAYVDIYCGVEISDSWKLIIRLWGNSSASLYTNASAELYDNASAILYDNASASLYDNASASLYDNASAVLYDNASARLYENSRARLYSNASAELFSTTIARNYSSKTIITAYQKSTIISHVKEAKYNLLDDAYVRSGTDIPEPDFDTWLERGYVVADGIYNKLISQEERNGITFYNTDDGCVARLDKTFAHGNDRSQAIADLRYKLSTRDKSQYKHWNLDTRASKEDMIVAYRVITGACSYGTNNFLQGKNIKEELAVKEAINITKGQYGHDNFKEFFE
jgi:hypothetical protein